MVQAAIVNDSHFGTRGNSLTFVEHMLDFYESQFFPYINEHSITEVYHLGDVFHHRKSLDIRVLSMVKERVFDRFRNEGISVTIVPGNHDVYYRQTNDVNSLASTLSEYDNIEICHVPTEKQLGSLGLLFVPWITQSNRDECYDAIRKSVCPIALGHFEMNGFSVAKNSVFSHEKGQTPDMFSSFSKVLSGHFHLRQAKGNVFYLGTQYQLDFGDVGSKKGFHVLSENGALEYVENTNAIFFRIDYDDSQCGSTTEAVSLVGDANSYRDKVVKIHILNRKYPLAIDKIVQNLENAGVYKLDLLDLTDVQNPKSFIDTETSEVKDTWSIIQEEMGKLDLNHRNVVQSEVEASYNEALTE